MVDRICDNCMNRVPADAEKCPKCGIRFENTNPGGALPNGWVLGGRYTIGRYNDIDGEGVTYSAIDGNTLQRVTIKEFMPVTLCAARTDEGYIVAKPGCEVLFKTTRMDFAELYNTLLRLGLAEGLVQVLDVLEANNTAYAVLEKIEGPTLTEYLVRQDAPMDTERALSVLRPVLLGVESMHAANIVHRGISPDNIILESGGTAKLGGFATLALRQQGSELKSKLYPGFSAPEQYTASEFEGRYTDIYALGAVLYRMVTGEAPDGADERKMQDNMPPARTLNKDVPTFLSTAIQRAMRVSPGERIQNIGDLRLALSGEGGRVPPPPRNTRGESGRAPKEEPERGPLGLTKQQLIVGGTALGAVVVILIVVLLLSVFGGNREPNSSSAPSSSSVVVDELVVPNFVGMEYNVVINNTTYTDTYTFGTPVEEWSATAPAGQITGQTPDADTDYEAGTPIVLTVSKGAEPVEMPNLTTTPTLRAEAISALTALGIREEDITVENVDNDGSYRNGEVTRTDPAPGEEVVPGETKITLYIAGEAEITSMPDVSNDPIDTARGVLIEKGFKPENITVDPVPASNPEGKKVGTVQSTDPAPQTQVAPAGQKVTIKVYGSFRMPDTQVYVGQQYSVIESAMSGYPNINVVKAGTQLTNDGSHAEGEIASVTGPARNDLVDKDVTVTVTVYGPPPAASPPPEAG